MPKSELTLVVPAYNEEESLRQYLPELLDFCEQHNAQLVIVNDCSKDGTGALLDAAAASHDCLRVCHHKVNRGYGGALISGLRMAETRFAMTLDADGQHQLADVLKLLEKQHETNADLVVGCRGGKSTINTMTALDTLLQIINIVMVFNPMQIGRASCRESV